MVMMIKLRMHKQFMSTLAESWSASPKLVIKKVLSCSTVVRVARARLIVSNAASSPFRTSDNNCFELNDCPNTAQSNLFALGRKSLNTLPGGGLTPGYTSSHSSLVTTLTQTALLSSFFSTRRLSTYREHICGILKRPLTFKATTFAATIFADVRPPSEHSPYIQVLDRYGRKRLNTPTQIVDQRHRLNANKQQERNVFFQHSCRQHHFSRVPRDRVRCYCLIVNLNECLSYHWIGLPDNLIHPSQPRNKMEPLVLNIVAFGGKERLCIGMSDGVR